MVKMIRDRTSHKSQNTFRFQTFSERLANINIDVIHKIGIRNETPEEGETFLFEAVEKWSVLNCTESFDALKEELGSDITTLSQLILREEEILKCLQKHLQIPGNLALQPLFELVIAVARDLQHRFYPHFPEFFKIIVKLLNTQDTDQLEQAFTCLSYLFKFLWRYMIKDIFSVYKLYSPLLSNQNRSHIVEFAGESFSFLIRKVPDKNAVFEFLFAELNKNPLEAEGVGKLLFQIMKGVQKQFNNCTEKILPIILIKLGKGLETSEFYPVETPSESVFEAQKEMMNAIVQYTEKPFTSVIWQSFLTVFECLILAQKKKSNPTVSQHTLRLLEVFKILVNFKDGILILNPQEVFQVLGRLIQCPPFSDEYGHSLVHIISSMILNHHRNLEVTKTREMIAQVFQSKYSFDVIIAFCRNLFEYSMFETFVLPHLINFCQVIMSKNKTELKHSVLSMLIEVLLYFSPLPEGENCIKQWKRYPLDFQNSNRRSSKRENNSLVNYLMSCLQLCETEDPCHLPVLWSALFILPHVRPLDHDLASKEIQNIIMTFTKRCKESSCNLDQNKNIISQALISLLLISKPESVLQEVKKEHIIDLLSLDPENISILRAVYYVIVYASMHNLQEFISTDCCSQILPLLAKNFDYPYHKVRLLTLRILSSFNYKKIGLDSEENEQQNIFEICLSAEVIEPNLNNYREKLMYLNKLEFGHIHHINLVDPYKQIPLAYLLGALYDNFQVLWDPILKNIESHARGMNKEEFWKIFMTHLKATIARTEKLLQEEDNIEENPGYVCCEDHSTSSLTELYFKEFSYQEERPDHINHRRLLWKALGMFHDIAEPRNRDISPLFLRYMEKEYYHAYYDLSSTQNLHKDDSSKTDEVSQLLSDIEELNTTENDEKQIKDNGMEENDKLDEKLKDESESEPEDEINIEQPNTPVKGNIKQMKKFSKRNNPIRSKNFQFNKTLCCHLEVFAKFHNPRAIYREPELKSLYLNLLTHFNSQVQKLALECILNYGDKSVTPYRENLCRLLNDKSFKSEIILFNIDVEQSIVQEEHRKSLIPLLIRILFAKMLSRTGKNTSGRKNALTRQKIVLHFLAGSKNEELGEFFNLAFHLFEKYIQDDVLTTVRYTKTNTDSTSVIPLKKIQSALILMGVIFKRLGSIIDDYLPVLLKNLLCIIAMCAALLEKREEFSSTYILPLRRLRSLALGTLNQFFKKFSSYPFTSLEIDAVFEAAVWPQLPRLHFESVYGPSELLKLFSCWSSHPRYFSLLAKYQNNEQDMNPVSRIIALFVAKGTKMSVTKTVLEMMENLVTLADFDPNKKDTEDDEMDDFIPEAKGPVIEVNNILPVVKDDAGDSNYGTYLLLPHLKTILDHLKKLIEIKTKYSNTTLISQILIILTRISEHVNDSGESADLIMLLLPLIKRQKDSSEEFQLHILRSVTNLLKFTQHPESFISYIAVLFSQLSNRKSRILLCEMIMKIADQNPNYLQTAEVVEKLNAWSSRWIEEPDYGARVQAFFTASKMFENKDTIDVNDLLLIVCNSCFYIRKSEDLSLKSSASHCLQKMIEIVAAFRNDDKAKQALISTIIPEFQKGIENNTESVRHEIIMVLATAVKAFPDLGCFTDLKKLTNIDPEIDFFENIRHIQIHRRSRALMRLIHSGVLIDFQEETLMKYIFPFANIFLFSENYTKHSYLIDAAIQVIGTICKNVSWLSYEKLLQNFLTILPKQLKYQNMAIKVTEAILDSFHFDLSQSKDNEVTDLEDNEEKEDEFKLPSDSICSEKPSANDSSLTLLSKNKASQIHHKIVKNILPKLKKYLNQKVAADSEHKLAKGFYAEDEEILRVPIILAMVKLLQKTPKEVLEQNLPGLFFKLCTFLKSRAVSIREAARSMLLKIMDSLGPKFFSFLLKQMKQLFKRGYQVHVMTFTIHAVLQHLTSKLHTGDLDGCLNDLIEVCNLELFGNVAEEKDFFQSNQNTPQLKEVQRNRSYNTYEIIGKFVSENQLIKLVLPLREILASTHSHKIVTKVELCLHHIALGLSENSDLPYEGILIFSYGLVKEAIPELAKQRETNSKKEKKSPFNRPDSYLINHEPTRGGETAKINFRTNSHVIVLFGLELLYFGLNKGKFQSTNEEHVKMLDPFIPMLTECLNSKDIKLMTCSLRSLCKLVKFPLGELRSHINRIGTSVFLFIVKYNSSSATLQREIADTMILCFKTVSFLLSHVDNFEISSEQLRLLLAYAEQDIETNQQPSTFSLLKAILSRKLIIPELADVMKKISSVSVTSESESIRLQCRQIFLQYLLDYPIGNQLQYHFEFYLNQLAFPLEHGRKSALEFITNIIKIFPERILIKHGGLIFAPLVMRLVNDSSAVCKEMAAKAFKLLIAKVPNKERDKFFRAIYKWLQDAMVKLRRLAAQLVGLFVEAEKEKFEHRFVLILPILTQQLDPSKFLDVKSDAEERTSDHLVYYLLNSLVKILAECNILKNPKYDKDMKQIWEYVEALLVHPYDWIRLMAAQLFGLHFAAYSVEDVVSAAVTNSASNNEFLLSDTKQKIRSLTLKCIRQLQSEILSADLVEQILKNLVYLSKIYCGFHKEAEKLESSETKNPISVDWLLQKMCREAKMEVAKNPRIIIKRTCVFKWLAAFSLNLEVSDLTSRLDSILLPLVRELSDNSTQADPELKTLATEVTDLLSSLVGHETFLPLYAKVQRKINEKRAGVKRAKAEEVINNPEGAARKKIKKHLAKKDSKKRKMERLRPTKQKKKKTLKDLAMMTDD